MAWGSAGRLLLVLAAVTWLAFGMSVGAAVFADGSGLTMATTGLTATLLTVAGVVVSRRESAAAR